MQKQVLPRRTGGRPEADQRDLRDACGPWLSPSSPPSGSRRLGYQHHEGLTYLQGVGCNWNKAPKRRAKAKLRDGRAEAVGPNHDRAMDLVDDELATGQRLRVVIEAE